MSEYQNTSGLRAVEYRVLIKPDSTEEVTAGGIILTDDNAERNSWAQVKGTIASIGGSAFEDWDPVERGALQPGARVYYSKYEGVLIQGADGEEYRLCNDKMIGAIILNELAAPVHLVHARTKGGMAGAA
jgi:co-chaperonin GroES (HSP10)|tara:strand:+ start:6661 stop:7050 length:390 start_codon:yes stop_codon:yes gene_type:complete